MEIQTKFNIGDKFYDAFIFKDEWGDCSPIIKEYIIKKIYINNEGVLYYGKADNDSFYINENIIEKEYYTNFEEAKNFLIEKTTKKYKEVINALNG